MCNAGLHLDIQYLKYETDFNNITKGINKYNSDIHVLDSNGKTSIVSVYYYRHIEIDDHNECTISIKNKTIPFTDFEDYERRLISDMAFMYRNAQDKNRNYKYGIVTMVSKGYDAPCCATIVKRIGGKTALTFKAEGRYKEDCGVEIAQELGYANVIERSAFEYKNREDMPEIEYLSSGELGAEISFSVFENDFKGNLVFTSERGDSIYDRLSKHRNEEFHFINMQSGLSNVERRLWHSYIPVPMPLYGATAWPSLYEIANSPQMAKWQMNNTYDRPIPRRIVETAGIPRMSFGVEKRGAGFSYHYDWMERILNRMSLNSAIDFCRFVHSKRKPHPVQFISFIVKTYRIYLGRLDIKNKGPDIEKLSSLPNPMAARYRFHGLENI